MFDVRLLVLLLINNMYISHCSVQYNVLLITFNIYFASFKILTIWMNV